MDGDLQLLSRSALPPGTGDVTERHSAIETELSQNGFLGKVTHAWFNGGLVSSIRD
jgi:hypothetical protein